MINTDRKELGSAVNNLYLAVLILALMLGDQTIL
jgi:hypothetical protein